MEFQDLPRGLEWSSVVFEGLELHLGPALDWINWVKGGQDARNWQESYALIGLEGNCRVV